MRVWVPDQAWVRRTQPQSLWSEQAGHAATTSHSNHCRGSSVKYQAHLQYRLSPGWATRRMANSCWNMMMAALNRGRWESSLKVSGEDIWYGMLATHRSK